MQETLAFFSSFFVIIYQWKKDTVLSMKLAAIIRKNGIGYGG